MYVCVGECLCVMCVFVLIMKPDYVADGSDRSKLKVGIKLSMAVQDALSTTL